MPGDAERSDTPEGACTYCDRDVYDHEAILVYEDDRVDDPTLAGQFCTYACLVEYVNREGLAFGEACHLD